MSKSKSKISSQKHRTMEPRSLSVDALKPNGSSRTLEIVPANPIIDYIYGEMKNNTSESSVIFHKIKKMNSEILLETGKYGRSVRTKNKPIEAMILFKTKIGYKRDWDHKETIYSTWGSLSKFDSFTIQYDAWSNIHYGYLGFLVGFDKRLLLDAAGIAQAKSSTVPEGYLVRVLKGEGIFSGLDDPLDQESISIGIELAVAHGHELTLKQFKTYLRREAYRISQDR